MLRKIYAQNVTLGPTSQIHLNISDIECSVICRDHYIYQFHYNISLTILPIPPNNLPNSEPILLNPLNRPLNIDPNFEYSQANISMIRIIGARFDSIVKPKFIINIM